jgi:hypothetical protein
VYECAFTGMLRARLPFQALEANGIRLSSIQKKIPAKDSASIDGTVTLSEH